MPFTQALALHFCSIRLFLLLARNPSFDNRNARQIGDRPWLFRLEKVQKDEAVQSKMKCAWYCPSLAKRAVAKSWRPRPAAIMRLSGCRSLATRGRFIGVDTSSERLLIHLGMPLGRI